MEKQFASVDGTVDIDSLLRRLNDDDGSNSQVVEQLAARVAEIRPEQLIRHALKLEPVVGMTLINLLGETRLPADFSGLEVDPANIDNPILQISLLRYLAQTSATGSAELLARFLDVPNRLVQMEALKALGRLKTDFDPSLRSQQLEHLSPAESDLAARAGGDLQRDGASPGVPTPAEPDPMASGILSKDVISSNEETRADQGLIDFVLDDDLLGTQIEARAQASLPPSLETIRAGQMWLNRYRIQKEIGRGAMGKAVLADDNVVDEKVVLKFMRPELVLDLASVERFRREVKYARRIGHRNVIRVHDLLIQDQLCAISMEYFESRGLDRILQRMGPLKVRDGLKIMYQIANGMTAAHQQSVVHRDLKPSNILIGKAGLLKILDFGIASIERSPDSTLTRVGFIVGSPAYMAPERISMDIADERSDIYSLGVVGYYIFGGRLPYEGELHEILLAHRRGNATPLARIRPEIPEDISNLIASMMVVDPAARLPSMLKLRNLISAMLE